MKPALFELYEPDDRKQGTCGILLDAYNTVNASFDSRIVVVVAQCRLKVDL